jgi:hypothetical protein
MSARPESSPYEARLRTLRDLTAGAERPAAWRDQRNAFAYRLGTALTEPHPLAPAAIGPVYLPTTGLCYVGQTKEAERRLRDLPIGESHHAAPDRLSAIGWAHPFLSHRRSSHSLARRVVARLP